MSGLLRWYILIPLHLLLRSKWNIDIDVRVASPSIYETAKQKQMTLDFLDCFPFFFPSNYFGPSTENTCRPRNFQPLIELSITLNYWISVCRLRTSAEKMRSWMEISLLVSSGPTFAKLPVRRVFFEDFSKLDDITSQDQLLGKISAIHTKQPVHSSGCLNFKRGYSSLPSYHAHGN